MEQMSQTEKNMVKPIDAPAAAMSERGTHEDIALMGPATDGRWSTLAKRLDTLGDVEWRGIERIPAEMRDRKLAFADYLGIGIIWFSMNCTVNQMTLGILGPVAYGLGFVDSVLLCMFGTILGSACAGYIASFGPASGSRTLIIARYSMGWWPSKICVVLNWVIEIGYGLVDCLVAGLILSAVNGNGMSVIVGIVITALISWLIAAFGIKWFHAFEKWISVPTVLILCIFIGCASPYFNTSAPSQGSGATLAGNRVSYFFLTMSGPLGWSPAAADYFVYFPENTSRWGTCLMSTTGITIGKLLIEFLGIGLGTALSTNTEWAEAFGSHGVGALLVAGFGPLQEFGKVCSVVLALAVTANIIPGAYAASLNCQQLGKPFAKIPRPIWTTVVVIVFAVCAIAGRTQLLPIFLNFLALIGYWVMIWIAIVAEDEFIFRRKSGYQWDDWNDQQKLPLGIAAFASFLVGWVGAILCMGQTYFYGPIARLVGDYGADLGLPVAFAWTALCYPVLRFLELKVIGR